MYRAFAILILLTGCTMDVVSVPASRVKSAKMAEEPLLRGPTAPGAFKYIWEFTQSKQILFDPSALEFTKAGARPKAKNVVFMTQSGPWFSALDSFKEAVEPGEGFARYQLSPDSSAWYYHDGNHWVIAGPNADLANSAEQISQRIGSFHSAVGEGTLTIKVFLVAPSAEKAMRLKSVEVQGVAAGHD